MLSSNADKPAKIIFSALTPLYTSQKEYGSICKKMLHKSYKRNYFHKVYILKAKSNFTLFIKY